MRRRAMLGLGGAALLALGAGTAAIDYRHSLRAARQAMRAAGTPRQVETRHGPLEYAEAGQGPAVLMLHGTGGGYDQGLLFARRLIAAGFRVIAPSRFGYLGTPFPADPGPEAQADALADLMQTLKLPRAAVIGGSAGAIPALAFALRHPGRTTALVPVVPASFVPGRPSPPPPNAFATWMIDRGLRSDLLVWAGLRLAEDRMIATLLATDPALVRAASPEEQARVRAILNGILPVSLKVQGLLNDARWAAAPPDFPLAAITAPTLAISARDDRFGTAAAAGHIAATVPQAELMMLETGGHVWVGHDEQVMARIAGFLRAQA
ncbi:alpha/beta hydrolase [Rhodobacter sp. Har01]|uniref:alpha/beta fold hydrolase n=1 Tax=Rhodobacter sp. Har01 TaxID=2883999 RepID=UPI001D07AF2D|nr:alpha/beta fold hydrolase [Rhodobacter sp. Har01]MCB6178812.1 alpha/beta hydrolase [Rhodobacter sp. Har01]